MAVQPVDILNLGMYHTNGRTVWYVNYIAIEMLKQNSSKKEVGYFRPRERERKERWDWGEGAEGARAGPSSETTHCLPQNRTPPRTPIASCSAVLLRTQLHRAGCLRLLLLLLLLLGLLAGEENS